MTERTFRVDLDPPKPKEPPVFERIPNDGHWVPGCNQTETPFWTRTGRHLLYCWNPVTGKHAYLDLQTDLILSDEEARLALGTY
jgi:hypothetical protein